MLQGVYSEMAQDAAWQRIEGSAAGLSRRCNYDMDTERNGGI